jgi:hypothetical protein
MIQSTTILSPDESYVLGVFYENGKLYAGYIFNSGVNKEWVIDYDKNFIFDENLQALYEVIQENYNN